MFNGLRSEEEKEVGRGEKMVWGQKRFKRSEEKKVRRRKLLIISNKALSLKRFRKSQKRKKWNKVDEGMKDNLFYFLNKLKNG